jgi:zinc-binding in reverse transcriptase
MKQEYTRSSQEGPYIASQMEIIWQINLPLRVAIFAWLLLQNRLLTIDNFIKKGWMIPNMCYMCRKEVETATHLFSECAYAMNVRRLLIRHYMMTTNFTMTFCQGDYHDVIKTHGNKKQKRLQITFSFVLWRERCSRIFREKQQNEQHLTQEIIEELTAWFPLQRTLPTHT